MSKGPPTGAVGRRRWLGGGEAGTDLGTADEMKDTYDPANFCWMNQNIEPTRRQGRAPATLTTDAHLDYQADHQGSTNTRSQ